MTEVDFSGLLTTAAGTAVAVHRDGEDVLLVAGTTSLDRPQPVDATTRFEIGSLTKVFTALLLAEMARRGEVRHDDPVDRYLGTRLGPAATLERLATHTAGLPRLPPGLLRTAVPGWRTNPYRRFGPAELATALHRTRPTRSRPAQGHRVRYSNYGVAILGLALARAADRPFEDLLAERVTRPLRLTDTGFDTAPQATGYLRGRPRPPWEIPGLPAAGALRSSARDMLALLTALLDRRPATLAAALTDVVTPRVAVSADDHLCLVWNLRRYPDHDLVFHSGATRGFTAFAGFSPQRRTALVTLTNVGPTLRSPFVQRSYDALRALSARPAGQAPPATGHGSQPASA
ncbi:CubicO group peptidase (beta-lactamase class C family) [Saccharothrix tamanrassetensis]|uniref:CubicO group peptidase (Beta-lactamase class C family) n=1 Tax=Saccharothrix tamanrassetensis TaxID=1051531 RepID=A0A841C527_9PSEU|nr:serine hydrolase domain-containing protein [Saccharothrix tamanrassetensis]MBB5953632.1 CubicO group peptidase (beta-lactamase class C family) [Saccharothrix tamanrassetensis]